MSDLVASERFYLTTLRALGIGRDRSGAHFAKWNDFSIAQASDETHVTRRLHVGFVAPSREHVEEFWSAGIEAGYRDDGPPGPRPQYRDEYYGSFLLDPDGNSAEAVHHGVLRTGGGIDHLWVRVADVAVAKSFYELIAPYARFHLRRDLSERAQFADGSAHRGSFSLVVGEPTLNLGMAFAATSSAIVEEFHRAAVAAGYRDNDAPGERRSAPRLPSSIRPALSSRFGTGAVSRLASAFPRLEPPVSRQRRLDPVDRGEDLGIHHRSRARVGHSGRPKGADPAAQWCVAWVTTAAPTRPPASTTANKGATMDWKLELIQIPVADIDRAKAFYTEKAGFNADQDHQVTDELRFVQLTPPGSACSIALTSGTHEMQPGSIRGLQLVVEDADAAREDLLARGVDVGDVQEFPWGRFLFFTDPDGNGWAVQQLLPRD